MGFFSVKCGEFPHVKPLSSRHLSELSKNPRALGKKIHPRESFANRVNPRKSSMLALIKGWIGEKGTQLGMWFGLEAEVYRRVHNLILPARGGTTQIDHVLVSVFGIFVIETKNMNGWIFGSERSPQWTQSIYGKKYPFQNPLHQNFRHTKALEEFLNLPESCFHPIVFFIGECELKTDLPSNVLTRGLANYIKSHGAQIFSPNEVGEIFSRLTSAKLSPVSSHSIHVSSLRERHQGNSCPKCGKAMVLRTSSKGANPGNQFYGCSGFPKCRYTRAVG